MAQIGTIRLQTQNSGTVSVPVFNTGDSGDNVYEFVRVQTASGTGFIPVVDPADASFPYLRVQSQNQGVVAVHNESNLQELITEFEACNLSNWSIDDSGGNAGVNDTTSLSGCALYVSGNGTNNDIGVYSLPGDGLNAYWDVTSSSQTYESRFNITNFNGGGPRFYTRFLMQNSSSAGYRVNYNSKNDTYDLYKEGGSPSDSKSLPNLNGNTWYYHRIKVDPNGDINVTLLEPDGSTVIETLSINDDTYQTGGFRFDCNGYSSDGGTVRVDNLYFI